LGKIPFAIPFLETNMRLGFLPLIALLFVSGCGNKISSDDQDTDTGTPPPPECTDADDSECLTFEICENEACVPGDDNNDVAEAKPILWEMDVPGYLQTDDDVDYYSFTAAGGEFVRVSTEPIGTDEEMNTIVTIYDPNGKVHHVEDEHASGNVSTYDTVLYTYLHMAGTWIIAVQDVEGYGSTTSQYNVKLTETSGHTQESDSLNSPSYSFEATQAGTFWAIGVLLGEEGDEDWIEVDLPWENCPVTVEGSQYLGGTDANPTVQFHLPDGTQLNRKEGLGPDGMAFYPEVNGRQLIISTSDSNGGGGDNHWFFIFLSIGESGYAYTEESEPNDLLEEANELESTWTTNDDGDPYAYALGWGTMGWEDDEDHYWLTVDQDQYLHVWGTAGSLGSLLNAEVEVYDPTGEVIGSGTEGDDNFPDVSNLGPLDAGNYSVRVRHEEIDGSGPAWWYRLSIFQTGYTVSE
jgi:hypothetical protein